MLRILIAALTGLAGLGVAGAQTEEKPQIAFAGYIKTDFFYDSRETVGFREGHFLLYPENEQLDAEGRDINDRANFNLLSVQTRLQTRLTGPDLWGGRTRGLIEAEFFGTSDADLNGFRLRHAYLQMDHSHSSLLIGQTWHPFFVAEAFPETVSFNTGAPFQPFSRNPQIRWVRKFRAVSLLAALASQRDFSSPGPGGSSSSYLRNSAMPDAVLQLRLQSGSFLGGMGMDYKTLVPSLKTSLNYRTDEEVSGLSWMGFLKYTGTKGSIAVQGVYGENLADMMMLGGYAVSAADPLTGAESYAPLRVSSVWMDASFGGRVRAGLFGGYTRNLGARDPLAGAAFGRGTDIADLLRLSPRVWWDDGIRRFALEYEYTRAAYGTPDAKGVPRDAHTVANHRLLLSAYYFFGPR